MACVFGAIAEHHHHHDHSSGGEEEGGKERSSACCSLLMPDRRRARACVRHAAHAYGLLRIYRSAACGAPAVLLHAVAVLWLYARMDDDDDDEPGSGSSDEAAAVVYLDELDGGAAAAQDFWVECGIAQPRVAGVGVLRTAAGRRRLLAEAEALCEAMGAWPTCWLYRRIFRRLGAVEGEGVM